MKKKYLLFFFVVITNIGTIHAAVEGALSGEFSVSATQKVHFSQGNLQYQASTNIWRFSPYQYSQAGNANLNASATYTGWIDLFAWGTSGYKIAPYTESNVEATFYIDGSKTKNISGTNYDWGVYNQISNGGNIAGEWRTLTRAEWEYLLKTRDNAKNKYSIGTVAGVRGLIFLPDSWSLPIGCTFSARAILYTTNTYSADQWGKMENAGAVFLPANGCKKPAGSKIEHISPVYGCYWSSTAYGTGRTAYFIAFYTNEYGGIHVEIRDGTAYSTYAGLGIQRSCRISVRLVINKSNYDNPKYSITTSATNGTVTGGGAYKNNATATLTATPDECYRFVQWSDGNTDNPRTITVTGNATYTAEFEKIQYTIEAQPADAGQGSATVTNP